MLAYRRSPYQYLEPPESNSTLDLEGINIYIIYIYNLGKRNIIFKIAFRRGYVSSQEGVDMYNIKAMETLQAVSWPQKMFWIMMLTRCLSSRFVYAIVLVGLLWHYRLILIDCLIDYMVSFESCNATLDFDSNLGSLMWTEIRPLGVHRLQEEEYSLMWTQCGYTFMYHTHKHTHTHACTHTHRHTHTHTHVRALGIT